MSQAQWGHGFHTGISASQKRKGFVGLCFHEFKENGDMWRQGFVRKRVGKKYLVTYFSWLDGEQNGGVVRELPTNVSWYNNAPEMREGLIKMAESGAHGVSGNPKVMRFWEKHVMA